MIIIAIAAWVVLAVAVLVGWPRFEAWRTGVLLLALAFALLQQLVFSTIPDSAFVTFRYADNIAAGHGAVFNVGERIEGYSNFLWLVLVTMPKALFGVDIATGAVVLSAMCALGCVVLAYRLGGILAAVLTAGAGGLAAYGLSGTETPLFVLLVLAVGYALVTRHPVVAGVLAALATMTRPDGLAFVVAAGLWLVLSAIRGRSNWWAPAGYLLGGLVFAVPWLAWRATYYAQSVTNWPTARFSLASYSFLLAVLIAVACGVVTARRSKPSPNPRRPVLVPVLALLLCGLSLPIAAGVRPEVLDRRARIADAAEIGSWLAARLPAGTVLSTDGGEALAYRAGTGLFVVGEYLTSEGDYATVASLRRPALAATETYASAQQCHLDPSYAGSYKVATFHRVGTESWVTVYPRYDEAARLIARLEADPTLVYVPC